MIKAKGTKPRLRQLPKSPTGIQGLDEILGGGLPQGRPTLVCGSAGCGKTLLAMEFLVRGATQFNEPGVFMSFEENSKELTQNFVSLGLDLKDLTARKMILLDHVHLERSEIEETGEYDLKGLFIRLGHAVDTIHAKRVVLDTIESLFAILPNPLILRAELRRLFRWLKDKGLTAIITGERGVNLLTRQGLEEYVSDCVIVLDQHVTDLVSTRRLRVVKYRGSTHGENEYPFLIDENGISVLPITSLSLQHPASPERVLTGIPRLDTMLGGQGYFRGSSVLVSGTAGTGKSSIAVHFADAACRRGEHVLYFAFEESPSQITRNMRSIGIHLEPWISKGLLQFQAARPARCGLEMHLMTIHKAIQAFQPRIVIVDPLTSFALRDNETGVKAMLMRVVDFLKQKQITGLFTNLTSGGGELELTESAVSSLMDTWLLLRDIEISGERNRGLYILKSRGMAHSNQIREFLLTDHGVELHNVYVGPGGVLTGSARRTQEAQEQAEQVTHQQEIKRRQRALEHKRKAMEAQLVALRAGYDAEESEALKVLGQDQTREALLAQERGEMARGRGADAKAKK